MEIIQRKVNDLIPYINNSRTHSEEQVNQIVASINEFGFTNPLLIDEKDNIIAGHGRLLASKKLKMEEVPCIVLSGLTEAQKKAYIIADNKMALNAGWDEELLKIELENLKELDFDLELTGFNVDELDDIFKVEEEQEIIEDDFDIEPPEEPKAKLGDIYQLGNHRLMCGDSTNEEDVAKLMNGFKADMVFTDPPYNANYSSRVDINRRKPWGGILNDKMNYDDFDNFLIDLNSTLYSVLKENSSIYECIDWKHYSQVESIFKEAFNHKSTIIWNKNYFGLGTYYRTKYEMILFGCKGEKLNVWNGNHDEMDVWDEDREKVNNYVHPTQKPLTIPARAIKNSSNVNDNILDTFGGSGSTLIACEQLNRSCYMMELDPKYVDVIIKRWEEFTGKKAIKLN
jgi:DNA modification methylase